MIMRRFLFIISALVFTVGFASCNATDWPDDEDGFLNQELVIKNADGTEFKTKNKLAIGNKKSYPIGSVFVGGGIADPSASSMGSLSQRARIGIKSRLWFISAVSGIRELSIQPPASI